MESSAACYCVTPLHAVPELTRSRNIKLNSRLPLRDRRDAIASRYRILLEDDRLPEMARDLFRLQADEYAAVQARLAKIEAKLMKWHREDDISRRIRAGRGIGVGREYTPWLVVSDVPSLEHDARRGAAGLRAKADRRWIFIAAKEMPLKSSAASQPNIHARFIALLFFILELTSISHATPRIVQ
jgi:transposase